MFSRSLTPPQRSSLSAANKPRELRPQPPSHSAAAVGAVYAKVTPSHTSAELSLPGRNYRDGNKVKRRQGAAMYERELKAFLANHPEIAQARKNWQSEIGAKSAELSVILAENRLPTADQIELIFRLTGMVGSARRLRLFLDIGSHIIQPETFWPAFHEVWTGCDDTWLLRDKLYPTLTRFKNDHPTPCDSLVEANADFFRGLPASINVYRGCSRNRVRGFSWTIDRQIGIGFSTGHRGIKVPNPVICSAMIKKCDVFSASVDREEQELVVDYKKLLNLRVVSVHDIAKA
jgi:hypothetical protein